MTKRKIYPLLILMTAFIFTACGKTSAGGAPESARTPSQAGQQETVPPSTREAIPSSTQEMIPSASASEETDRSDVKEGGGRTAVIYFSATGTTAQIAQLIAEEAGADIVEIVPETAYTAEDLRYQDDNCRANKEMNDDTARPAISSDLSRISEYDLIYLGYPIWWGTTPRIIQTFFESCDLSKATVYTFCTSGGSGVERSVEDLKSLYPDVNLVSGRRLNGASKADIKDWIDSLD